MSDVKLLDYLPTFLREYREFGAIANAEEPELRRFSTASVKLLKNQFIETADADGIAEFEQILGILPSSAETLESRRSRVLSRWFSEIPYTLRTLILKLKALCGDRNFSVEENYDFYEIKIKTELELLGQVDELSRIIESIVPCNMQVFSENTISASTAGSFGVGGVVSVTESAVVSGDFCGSFSSAGGASGAGIQFVEIIGI